MTSLRPLGACPKNKDDKIKKEVMAEMKEPTLWKWFSLFVRLRDCVEGSQGFARCISCGKPQYFKSMDAGHYISRRFKPTKYDERNVHAQCVSCNQHKSGNVDEYAKAIGVEVAQELYDKSREPAKKLKLWEVVAMTKEYRLKAKNEAYRVGVEIR